MTVPLRICTTCQSSIPKGELYCPKCGASSPTEGVDIGIGDTRVERVSGPGVDLVARRAEVQAALGANFEVKSLIGRGGFGEVWSALDVQLGRDVAVKVLRPEVGNDPQFRKRFRREARAVARLRHPGIVPIYHVGESGGMVWFIMPLVDGITLRAALAAPGGLSRDEAVRILIEASASLGEAHARGIVHRDIKPENIMLEGPQRRVLLMDFGVAKVEGPAEGAEGSTEADLVLGSPEYMSPEQATASALDGRSDIYSLGVVAYRMLSGRLPFESDTPREMLAHHVLSAPARLQDYAPVRAALADAVMRCLAKAPDARWQTAADFARALAAAAPSASALAANPVPRLWTRLVGRLPFLARRRNAVLAALLLIVVLAAAVVWPLILLQQRREWTSAAAAIALVYRHDADSLGMLADAFARGDLTGSQLVGAREDVLATAEAEIEDRFSAALEDSARWPASARRSVGAAAHAILAAGARVATFAPRPSEVPGCRLVSVGDALRLTDEAPHTNCWFAAGAGAALAGPIEYFARFRLPLRVRSGAGVGLAWCRNDGECRIVFVWPAAAAVWGAHHAHGGLSALALGRRVALAPGDHELSVRWESGVLRCRLDGGLVLERRAGADSTFLERPDSVALVVQNTRLELSGPGALGAVGSGHLAAQQ
ncbi:MAG: serine/threonine-protein kinase [Gemmatimonadales bacterium]